jgi:fructan beta-fructosidase
MPMRDTSTRTVSPPARRRVPTIVPCVVAAGLGVAAFATAPNGEPQAPAAPYDEPWRPQFHFTPERNFMNDPNGLVHFDGEYHLFYQYNPQGTEWGHMSWGHAVSRDLVRWTHLPVAIPEYEWMVFSGSAVVDQENTSGLCADEGARTPCLVAVYTAHSDTRQHQNLAYSRDRGRTWVRYSGNPVLDLGMKDFRDPKVMRDAERNRWVMAVALPNEHKVRFFGSTDLRKWDTLSDFGPAGATGGQWECPDLLRLPVENMPGQSRWVLMVSINPGAPYGGSAVQYFVGDFDGTRFVAEGETSLPTWADHGMDFYAAQSWADLPAAHDRPVWIGWISNWEYANVEPTATWRGAQSVPRTLALRRSGDRFRLVQQPVGAIASLRDAAFMLTQRPIPTTGPVVVEGLTGDTLDIEATFEAGRAAEFGLLVRRSATEETVVGYDTQAKQLFVDRQRSGRSDFRKGLPERHAAPLVLPANGRLTLRVLVDRSSVEVFADGGVAAITDRVYPSPDSREVALFSRGASARLVDLKAWTMRSAWAPEGTPASSPRP